MYAALEIKLGVGEGAISREGAEVRVGPVPLHPVGGWTTAEGIRA